MSEQFIDALQLSGHFLPFIVAAPLVVVFVCALLQKQSLKRSHSAKSYKNSLWFGWAPGFVLTMLTFGGLYPLITGIWAPAVYLMSIGVMCTREMRIVTIFAAFLVSSLHFFLA